MGKDYVWVMLIIILSHCCIASGLDYDREIRRQERSVKVQYRRPPRSLASFLKHYPECRQQMGQARLRCNQVVAQVRYHIYFLAWQESQRRVSSVDTGDMAVQLEKRSR